jgi:hypothetical protein
MIWIVAGVGTGIVVIAAAGFAYVGFLLQLEKQAFSERRRAP